MLITSNKHSFNILFDEDQVKNKIAVLFLHGFTGSVNDWDFILGNINRKFTPIFLDLLGHGNSDAPIEGEPYSFESQIKTLDEIINNLSIDKLVLVGYSMGGRLATLYSLKYPNKIRGLILESTSFGIKDLNERRKRINSDIALAKRIEMNGVENFVDFWLDQPLFNSLKNLSKDRLIFLKENKISTNNLRGLINSLLEFGAGKMRYLLPEMVKIKCKVLLISGSLDQKYNNISIEALEQIPDSKLKIVEKTGHNVHFENPEVFLKLTNEFLSNMWKIDGI